MLDLDASAGLGSLPGLCSGAHVRHAAETYAALVTGWWDKGHEAVGRAVAAPHESIR
jgi:hypothetical protein